MATAAPPDTAHYAVDRPTGGDRAVLVHVAFGERPSEDHQAEFRELAESAGAIVVACEVVSRASPEPKYLIGSGKVEQIRAQAVESQVELALVDHALTPSQERNLERALGCRVLDRSGLILDIFAQRARSHEGKLQVELAQLRHLST
ncbi:MAG: GTPase HflX, partial [Pseudomonadota bacterium]